MNPPPLRYGATGSDLRRWGTLDVMLQTEAIVTMSQSVAHSPMVPVMSQESRLASTAHLNVSYLGTMDLFAGFSLVR
jgi:hypothetical protein